MSNKPLVWTDDRCAELWELRILLRELAAINSGSDCLRRIANCIAIAESLQYTDIDKGRESFSQFLRNLAINERTEFKGE